MSRSRNYQRSTLPWGKDWKHFTKRFHRADEKKIISRIMKDVDNVEELDYIFLDYHRYDDSWNWD